jgi:hypothetical protein
MLKGRQRWFFISGHELPQIMGPLRSTMVCESEFANSVALQGDGWAEPTQG